MRFKQFASLLALTIVGVAGCGRDDSGSKNPEIRRGYRLVYEVHWDSKPPSADTKNELIQATNDRLESLAFPSEVKLLDESRLEIKIPTPKKAALAVIRQVLPRKGRLELRIVVAPETHGYIINAAFDGDNDVDNVVFEDIKADSPDSRTAIGKWVRIGRVSKPVEGMLPFRLYGSELVIRDAKTKQWITLDPSVRYAETTKIDRWLHEQGHQDVEMLIAIDDGYDIRNQHIKAVRNSFDRNGNPSISFEMSDQSATLMESFTHEFKPDGEESYRLAIVVDDEAISAPRIQSPIAARGEITGTFTMDEIMELSCLFASHPIPARLSEKPIKEHAFEDD